PGVSASSNESERSVTQVGNSLSLTVLPREREQGLPTPSANGSGAPCLALIGNPNAGKTTLFNRLTGLRAKTANFPGTTVECRRGRMSLSGHTITVLDMPGLYGFDAGSTEEIVAARAVRGELPKWPKPTAAVVVVDATRV